MTTGESFVGSWFGGPMVPARPSRRRPTVDLCHSELPTQDSDPAGLTA